MISPLCCSSHRRHCLPDLPFDKNSSIADHQYAARRALVASSRAATANTNNQAQLHTTKSVSRPSAADIEAERLVREEAQHEEQLHTDESEEEFGDLEDALDLEKPQVVPLDWSDRYRPRKPRYFNRVLTGFEWNRYNQTHYE